MNSPEVLRKGVSLIPGPLALAVVLSTAPGYELSTFIVAVSCLGLFAASLLIRSDGLHIVSLSGLAVLLSLAASRSGFLLSFAAVTSLLVLFDMVVLVRSLFGLTYPKVDPRNAGTSSAYLGILKKQAVRSSGVGLATLLVSMAIVSTPLPLVTFANPVSGSGLLALAALLLIALAASGTGPIRQVFGRS